jgi:hypothetical protein
MISTFESIFPVSESRFRSLETQDGKLSRFASNPEEIRDDVFQVSAELKGLAAHVKCGDDN